MFVNAIETVAQFTSPIHTIDRFYNSTAVRAGAATMFFVNEEGVAVTCKHVASLFTYSDSLAQKFRQFKSEQANDRSNLNALIKKYQYDTDPICEMLIRLNCAASIEGVEVTMHPKYDLAIVRLIKPQGLSYGSFARFAKAGAIAPQGKFLCRLGFPFPEFRNFQYNADTDSIQWNMQGVSATPRFPIEGMVTRHLADEQGLYGIEMSTPGLKGQSGGPLFNDKGTVYGMQFATNHLHLGFDMHHKEIMANGEKINIEHHQPFLHVGMCIHSDVITAFLREHHVKYYTEQ